MKKLFSWLCFWKKNKITKAVEFSPPEERHSIKKEKHIGNGIKVKSPMKGKNTPNEVFSDEFVTPVEKIENDDLDKREKTLEERMENTDLTQYLAEKPTGGKPPIDYKNDNELTKLVTW